MRRIARTPLAAVPFVLACTEVAPPPRPPGEPEALLDRAVRPEVRCAVEAGVTPHAPRSWYQGGHTVVADGEVARLVRTESTPPNPFEPAPVSLVAGALEADGGLGETTTIDAVEDPFTTAAPAAAVVEGRLMVVWLEGSALRAAVEDPDGAFVAHDLGLPANVGSRLALVAGHGGAALAWSRGDLDRHTLAFARLDAGGRVAGEARELAVVAQPPLPALVTTPAGWAVTFLRDDDLRFVPLSRDGAPGAEVSVARPVARGTTFDRGQTALLAHGDGFLAAWVEAGTLGATADPGDPGFVPGAEDAFTSVRLARLDARGAALGPAIRARTPEADVTEAEPRLSWLGGRAVLTWARGSVIHFCGGCVPDHRVDLVVFDPERLEPLGEVATLPAVERGGLLQREEAWVGDALHLAFGLTFHVHSEPATAVLRCVED